MRRLRTAAGALLAVLAAGVTARADDLGGDGFAVPVGIPWEEARGRLVVQLRGVDDAYAEDGIFRQDIPHTRTVLMLAAAEAGGAARDVRLLEAAPWKQRPEALFRIGIENLERRFPAETHTTPDLGRGVKVNLFFAQHPFAAAYALSVDEFRRCRGRKGSLIAVPNRHAFLCYPIESSRAFHGYLALVNLAASIQDEGDDPIVPHVYWHHEGRFDTQRVTIEGDRYDTERSPAFQKMIEDLPRDIHDTDRRRTR